MFRNGHSAPSVRRKVAAVVHWRLARVLTTPRASTSTRGTLTVDGNAIGPMIVSESVVKKQMAVDTVKLIEADHVGDTMLTLRLLAATKEEAAKGISDVEILESFDASCEKNAVFRCQPSGTTKK